MKRFHRTLLWITNQRIKRLHQKWGLGNRGFAIAELIGVSGVSGDDGGRCARLRGGVVGNAGVMGDNFSEVFDMEDEVDAAEKCPWGRQDKPTGSFKLGRSDEMRSEDIRSDGPSDRGDDELTK